MAGRRADYTSNAMDPGWRGRRRVTGVGLTRSALPLAVAIVYRDSATVTAVTVIAAVVVVTVSVPVAVFHDNLNWGLRAFQLHGQLELEVQVEHPRLQCLRLPVRSESAALTFPPRRLGGSTTSHDIHLLVVCARAVATPPSQQSLCRCTGRDRDGVASASAAVALALQQ